MFERDAYNHTGLYIVCVIMMMDRIKGNLYLFTNFGNLKSSLIFIHLFMASVKQTQGRESALDGMHLVVAPGINVSKVFI